MSSKTRSRYLCSSFRSQDCGRLAGKTRCEIFWESTLFCHLGRLCDRWTLSASNDKLPYVSNICNDMFCDEYQLNSYDHSGPQAHQGFHQKNHCQYAQSPSEQSGHRSNQNPRPESPQRSIEFWEPAGKVLWWYILGDRVGAHKSRDRERGCLDVDRIAGSHFSGSNSEQTTIFGTDSLVGA